MTLRIACLQNPCAAEVLTSLVPPEVPRSELRFAEPLSAPEDLKRVIERLCEDLCRDLETRGVGARRLDLVFLRVDNLAQAVRIGLSRPYREPKHLAKLLAERLVLVDPGFGIETASLTGSWVEAITERQTVGRHVGADGADVDVSQLGRKYRHHPPDPHLPAWATSEPARAASHPLL
jgi:protein ImuB